LIETGVQVTPTVARPTALRVDRVVISRSTGLVSVVAGTEGSMAPPALPADVLPCARVFLRADMPAITDADIIDERTVIDTTPVSSTPVVCRVSVPMQSASIPPNVATPVVFTSVQHNVGNAYNVSTGVFKPTTAGYYEITFSITFTTAAVLGMIAFISKTGSSGGRQSHNPNYWPSTINNSLCAVVHDIFYLNGEDDFVTFKVDHSAATSLTPQSSNSCFMSAIKVG